MIGTKDSLVLKAVLKDKAWTIFSFRTDLLFVGADAKTGLAFSPTEHGNQNWQQIFGPLKTSSAVLTKAVHG